MPNNILPAKRHWWNLEGFTLGTSPLIKDRNHFFEGIGNTTNNAEEGKVAKIRLLLKYFLNWLDFHILGSEESMTHHSRNKPIDGIR